LAHLAGRSCEPDAIPSPLVVSRAGRCRAAIGRWVPRPRRIDRRVGADAPLV